MPESVQFLTVSEEEAGQRLDNYLSRILKSVPRSLIYRIIRKGEVRINKGRAKPDRKLQIGDVVRIPPVRLDARAHVPKPSGSLSQLLERSVLYEDAGVLVVNKPAGLAVHGGSGISLGLVEALRQLRQDTYLELVHRLDRETSGCIALAKKRSVLRQLHEKLRNETGMDKQYLALVKGRWSERKGFVDVPLKRSELKSGTRLVCVDPEGKTSKTLFKIATLFDDCTLVRASPVTGRTHQIRVHAQHARHPLAGDEKYGNEDFNTQMKSLGMKRLFLHASSLSFSLRCGKSVHAEAPLPEDLESVLTKLTPYNG